MIDSEADPWRVKEADYPVSGGLDERLEFLLRYAILAPSSHNSQPWKFRIADGAIELFADRRRALAVVDPQDRELTISCGAALLHLLVAIRHFGNEPTIEFARPADPTDLLARVRFGPRCEPTEEMRDLFAAIPRRRTNRATFEVRAVPDSDTESLCQAAREESAWLEIISDERRRSILADLVTIGDRAQGSDRRFRRELEAWIFSDRGESLDGIPALKFGPKEWKQIAGPLVIRTFDWSCGRAARDQQIALGSPVLAVLGTRSDSSRDWLRAGLALGRVLLLATHLGLDVSYLNQPIEVPELRPRLRDLLAGGDWPQLILRMGYGPTVKSTPRRPVERVIVK